MVWTDYEISLSETLKGEPGGASTIVSFAGGKSGDLEVAIAGVPELHIGRRYALFLMPKRDYVSGTVGWGQGIFEIVSVEIDTKLREVLISFDNEILELTDDGDITRGDTRVAVEENRLVPLSTEQSEPREPDPAFIDSTGRPAPLRSLVRSSKTGLAGKTFATLSHFRRFIKSEIEEANPKGH